MTITAKYAATCATCGGRINPGQQIEWSKGSPVRHTACGATSAAPAAPKRRPSRNWGAYRKACVSDGNCSSMGSGRSCGGHDCDGY